METCLQVTDNKFIPGRHNNNGRICVSQHAERKNLKPSTNVILFIKRLKDYRKVITAARTIGIKQSISSIEERLPKKNFYGVTVH